MFVLFLFPDKLHLRHWVRDSAKWSLNQQYQFLGNKIRTNFLLLHQQAKLLQSQCLQRIHQQNLLLLHLPQQIKWSMWKMNWRKHDDGKSKCNMLELSTENCVLYYDIYFISCSAIKFFYIVGQGRYVHLFKYQTNFLIFKHIVRKQYRLYIRLFQIVLHIFYLN